MTLTEGYEKAQLDYRQRRMACRECDGGSVKLARWRIQMYRAGLDSKLTTGEDE